MYCGLRQAHYHSYNTSGNTLYHTCSTATITKILNVFCFKNIEKMLLQMTSGFLKLESTIEGNTLSFS
jgi:hypothetical protein